MKLDGGRSGGLPFAQPRMPAGARCLWEPLMEAGDRQPARWLSRSTPRRRRWRAGLGDGELYVAAAMESRNRRDGPMGLRSTGAGRAPESVSREMEWWATDGSRRVARSWIGAYYTLEAWCSRDIKMMSYTRFFLAKLNLRYTTNTNRTIPARFTGPYPPTMLTWIKMF